MVKKIALILLSVVMLFQLFGCGRDTSDVVYCPSCSSIQDGSVAFCNNCGFNISNYGGYSGGGGGYSGGGGGYSGGGSDYFECAICNGRGYTECYACYGKGCSFCDRGYVDCGCDNGKMYYGGEGGYSGGGYSGPSTETQPCQYCDNGYVSCYLCGGSGKHGSYTVGGFDGAEGAEVSAICSACGGRKVQMCNVCYGTGSY